MSQTTRSTRTSHTRPPTSVSLTPLAGELSHCPGVTLKLSELIEFLAWRNSGLEGLRFPACTQLLGPVVEGTTVPNGARVPGTPYVLDPIRAAFNIGTQIRFLDFNGEHRFLAARLLYQTNVSSL